jgi:hypothetical protein
MIDSFIMVWVMEIAWDEPLLDAMDDCGLQWIQLIFLSLFNPLVVRVLLLRSIKEEYMALGLIVHNIIFIQNSNLYFSIE